MNLSKNISLAPNIFSDDIELKATRTGFGDGLVEAGEKDPNIVVLTADLSESTQVEKFKKKFPHRFFDVGVAEQNLAGIAAGLGLSGKVAFMASYAVFSPGRNWDQIRVSICFSKANVKIASSHAGLYTGADGPTHQALEDLALTRVLPNLVVLSPADYWEAKKATIAAAKYKGPVYIRLVREKTPVFTTAETPFELGKAQILAEGSRVTVIAHGAMVYEALTAAYELKNELSCEVVNCATVKPLDKETILRSVRKTHKVVVVEDHQVIGGLGEAICAFLAQDFPVPVKLVGVQDTFAESGKPAELLEKYKINKNHIKEAILGIA